MKLCCAPGCTLDTDEKISLVFCEQHELEYQQAETMIVDREPTKKDAGWNVEIFKEKK